MFSIPGVTWDLAVTWQWCSIIDVPSVALSVSSVFVGFPSWLAIYVDWLSLRPGSQRVPAAVCPRIPTCVPCSYLREFGVCCFSCAFCVPSFPPPFSFFFFFFFSTGLWLVAGVQVVVNSLFYHITCALVSFFESNQF